MKSTLWDDTEYNANHGAGGYNVQSWHNSELCEYVRQIDHPIDETVFSNYPDALYIMADVLAKQSPVRQLYNSSETTGVSGANIFIKYPSLDGALLVWFVPNQRKYLFTLTELEIFCELDVVKHLADGTIYRIRCPNNTIDKEK